MAEDLVHVWHHCHHCEAAPIVGKRYHCETCPAGPDNDLCEKCYELLRKGEIKHPVEASPAAAAAAGTANHDFTLLEGKPVSRYDGWLPVNHPGASSPKVPDRFVVRPIFTSGADSVIGGYAFLLDMEERGIRQPLLVTALHVMDEMIKKKNIDSTGENGHYTGKELPAVITGVSFYDVFAPNWMLAHLGSAGPMLVLPGARTDDEEPFSDRDIAAFRVKVQPGASRNLNPVPLARRAPAKGDPIWLAARPNDHSSRKTFKAVVVEITPRSLVFKYEDPAEKPKYSSGAPVLDRNGEVAGIVVGGGEIKGQKLGHANHVDNIRRHLGEAMTGNQ
jgi:hypothetical protein